MELIIVIVVVGVLSAYAMMTNSSSSVFSLLSQAQTLAGDIKHVQSMATVWGKSLTITATTGTNGTYTVSCTTATAAPCDTNPVINPATGTAFTISLQKGVVLTPSQGTLVINSLGKPLSAAQYVLSSGSVNVTVDVADLTGHVTVTP